MKYLHWNRFNRAWCRIFYEKQNPTQDHWVYHQLNQERFSPGMGGPLHLQQVDNWDSYPQGGCWFCSSTRTNGYGKQSSCNGEWDRQTADYQTKLLGSHQTTSQGLWPKAVEMSPLRSKGNWRAGSGKTTRVHILKMAVFYLGDS